MIRYFTKTSQYSVTIIVINTSSCGWIMILEFISVEFFIIHVAVDTKSSVDSYG